MSKYQEVWKSLEDEEYRREFNLDIDTGLAFQIKMLREKNGWTQEQLAQRAGSKQETICQWENPNYGRYTLMSLKTLAVTFDVGLMVRFVPFSELVNWNTTLTPQRIAPPGFTEENEARRVAHSGPPVFVVAALADEGDLVWPASLLQGTTVSDEEMRIRPHAPAGQREESRYVHAA
ncbi:MAG: helix-turn-helix transcriptional regulator [Dehalococcoidia bacterium]